MFEIDCSIPNKAEPPLEPARPILASHLLKLEEKQRKRFTDSGKGERVKTGCGEVDELLGGGFERGILIGISADGNVGRLISLHLLASVLISHLASSATNQPCKAIVIDTTGSFPLSLLAKALKSRILAAQALSVITNNQTANYQLAGQSKGKQASNSVDDEVRTSLEMVALSRVFDIEGLWEVLDEVGRGGDAEQVDDTAVEDGVPANGQEGDRRPREIVDSQEETTPPEDEITPASPLKPGKEETEDQGTEIIIIDNITHIINELFARKDKGDAHTLLSSLSQTLHTLASTQNILTILHNTVVSSKPAYNPVVPPQNLHNPHAQPPPLPSKKPHPAPKLPKSIFLSNPLKPALGHIFASFPSLHLFLSPLPKSRADADILYGQDEDSAPRDLSTIDYCTVFEVLKDEAPILGADREKGRKFGWREQRWTAVEVDAEGTGLVGAFQVKGNMRGMGLEREQVGGLTEVGRIAKVHGFGGRRV